MAQISRMDKPPHKIRVVWVDVKRGHHTYCDVDLVRWNKDVWEITFMDGRTTYLQFDLVLCIETLEPSEPLEVTILNETAKGESFLYTSMGRHKDING